MTSGGFDNGININKATVATDELVNSLVAVVVVAKGEFNPFGDFPPRLLFPDNIVSIGLGT